MRLAGLLLAASLLSFCQSTGIAQPSTTTSQVAADPSSQLETAKKLSSSGHAAEALALLDILAKTSPEPAGVERLRGFIYYQQKKMGAAEYAFARAVAQDPSDHESMQMRGVALYSLGRPADALPLLEQAHVSVPAANVDPNYMLGVCYIALRRYDDARHSFAEQYGFPPDSAAAYLLAARLLLRQENREAAEAATRKALALELRLPLAHLLLGEMALAKGQLPDAIENLEAERELNPLNAEVYDRLGDAYVRSGNDAKAQDALSRAVLLDPNATGPYVLLGRVMLNQQNPALAALYLERAIGMDPGSPVAHTLLGEAYRKTGRTTEADKQLQVAEQLGGGKKVGVKLENLH